jgi:hypothetical protein
LSAVRVNLPSWIEFHDSTLTSINASAATREIVLDAYVHRWELINGQWRGTGWEQPVRIVMQNAVGPSNTCALPAAISAGELRANEATPGNLVSLPFKSSAEFDLSLQLLGGGVVEISGRGLQIEAVGDGNFIEDLPAEWKPD